MPFAVAVLKLHLMLEREQTTYLPALFFLTSWKNCNITEKRLSLDISCSSWERTQTDSKFPPEKELKYLNFFFFVCLVENAL
jgi:hypothetical protein